MHDLRRIAAGAERADGRSPADFERRMNWAEFEAYLVSSGFDAKISAALAASEDRTPLSSADPSPTRRAG